MSLQPPGFEKAARAYSSLSRFPKQMQLLPNIFPLVCNTLSWFVKVPGTHFPCLSNQINKGVIKDSISIHSSKN